MNEFRFELPLGDEDELMTVDVLHYSPGTPDRLAARWEDSEQGEGAELSYEVTDGEGRRYSPTPAEERTIEVKIAAIAAEKWGR